MNAINLRSVLIVTCFGFCCVLTQQVGAGPIAHLVLDSEPGDFVGGGKQSDLTFTPENSLVFDASILSGLDVSGEPAFLRFDFLLAANLQEDATLDFATNELGIPFAVGTYTNAQRAAFASPGHPGLDVTFESRGSNTLTGSFTVDSVSFFTDAGILEIGSLDVSFEQHTDGLPPALFGHFTFSAPEPESLALIGAGLAGLGFARRRKLN